MLDVGQGAEGVDPLTSQEIILLQPKRKEAEHHTDSLGMSTLDPDFAPLRWSLHDPRRQTLWGQPAPRSWFEEGSEFSGVPTREPVVKAEPLVAATG